MTQGEQIQKILNLAKEKKISINFLSRKAEKKNRSTSKKK
jgi:hypothetical protein